MLEGLAMSGYIGKLLEVKLSSRPLLDACR